MRPASRGRNWLLPVLLPVPPPVLPPVLSPVLSPVLKRERTSAEHGPDRERGPCLSHARDRQDPVEEQLLVAVQVRHGRLDEEVVTPGDEIAGDHGGDGEQALLDP